MKEDAGTGTRSGSIPPGARSPRGTKTDRIILRVTPQQKQLLQDAAQRQDTTMTHFVLERSVQAAQEILAVDRRFVLNAEQWEGLLCGGSTGLRGIFPPCVASCRNRPCSMDRPSLSKGVSRIAPHHQVQGFDCGSPALDQYLERFAMANDRSDGARTFVALRGERVVGCFSLAASSVEFGDAPQRLVRGLARHPVPCILLARLAVDRSEQGTGLGSSLTKQAMLKCVEAAEAIAARAIVVEAKDDGAAAFYRQFGFEPWPARPRLLLMLMKDVRVSLREEPTPGL